LPETAFSATLQRLERLRERYELGEVTPDMPPADPGLRTEAERIAAGTIAVLGGGTFAPIAGNVRALIVDFQRLRSSEAEDPFNRGGIVRDEARRLLPSTRVATLSHQPRSEEARFAIEAARSITTLVLMTRDATDFPYQVEIGRQVIDAAPPNTRVIHVALRGPYDAGLFGPVDDTLLTFGDPAVTLKALAGVLAGVVVPDATVPVTLPDI
jgi:hypothetical protein